MPCTNRTDLLKPSQTVSHGLVCTVPTKSSCWTGKYKPTTLPVCCFLQSPCGLWYLQWASYNPKFTNESSQYLSVSCPKHNRTKSSAPQGYLSAGLWPLQQLSTQFRQGTAVRKVWERTAEWWEPWKRQTGDAALANASQAVGRVPVLCPRKPLQRAWSWFLFLQREKKTCRRGEKQRSHSGNERGRTEEH